MFTCWMLSEAKLELMELENIVANTVYLKAREGKLQTEYIYQFSIHPISLPPFL